MNTSIPNSKTTFFLALAFFSLNAAPALAQIPDETKQFRVGISSAMNTYFDETMMYFEAGVPAYDQYDVVKPPFSTNGAPQIMTTSVDGANLIMNSFGTLWQETSIPLKVKAGVSGVHTLRFHDGPGFMGATCIRLEDTQTGSVIIVNEGDSVDVTLDVNDPLDPARFNLIISTTNSYAQSNVSCFGMNDGEIAILGGGFGPWTYNWYGPGGIPIQSQANHNGVSKLDNANAGVYRVDIIGTGNCGMLSSHIEITSPPAINAVFDITDEHCTLIGDGSILVQASGGVGPYNYVWSGGGTDPDTSGLSAGTYSLIVYDASGCSRSFPAVDVLVAGGPRAVIGASSYQAMINEPIYFENGNHTGVNFYWSFGDGETAETEDPQHAFALPGIYEVRLIVDDLSCTDTAYASIEVGVNGITDIGPFKDVQVYAEGNGVQIIGHDYVLDQSYVSVIDAAGRELVQTRALGKDRYISLNYASSGVYRVIFTNPAGRIALPVSIIR